LRGDQANAAGRSGDQHALVGVAQRRGLLGHDGGLLANWWGRVGRGGPREFSLHRASWLERGGELV
jgi:hypothetical protein